MPHCRTCGGRLAASTARFAERFFYMGVFECPQCKDVKRVARRYTYYLGERGALPLVRHVPSARAGGEGPHRPNAAGIRSMLMQANDGGKALSLPLLPRSILRPPARWRSTKSSEQPSQADRLPSQFLTGEAPASDRIKIYATKCSAFRRGNERSGIVSFEERNGMARGRSPRFALPVFRDLENYGSDRVGRAYGAGQDSGRSEPAGRNPGGHC